MNFKPYESKPVIRMAFQITNEHAIEKSSLNESTYFCTVGDVQIRFKAHEEPKTGDWIVRLTDTDIYHCTDTVFRERNIVHE